MGRWLVNQNDTQFSVGSLAELKELAQSGRLSGGDMIQPPGANDWLYATEIDELRTLVGGALTDDVDDFSYKSSGRALSAIGVLLMLAVLVLGGGGMWYFIGQIPDPDASLIGEGGLTYSQMIVTDANQVLLLEAEQDSKVVTGLQQDQVLDLLAKRGDFYKARTEGGSEGWVSIHGVIPMYLLGGGDVREEYDPLYNPDRYVYVLNASWLQLPEQRDTQVTVFQFMLRNTSAYDVTDLAMLATIRDAKGHELETVEIKIGGLVKANSDTMVGMLAPADDAEDDAETTLLTSSSLQTMAEDDPDVYLRYTDGIEITMSALEFTEADIDIVELRAIPTAK